MSIGRLSNFNDMFRQELLDSLRSRLQERAYSGYPAFADRLHSGRQQLLAMPDGRLIIPEGPWTVPPHPNRRRNNDATPTPQQQAAFVQAGLRLDSLGRPLHPWFDAMYNNPDVGVVTGRGFYYHWGPNLTADPIIIRGNTILLVVRKDTRNLAFPGGFIDPSDARPQDAAVRETLEEAGVPLPSDIPCQMVYNGPVADLRATAHAWPETCAYLIRADGLDLPEPKAADDAAEAKWIPIADALNGGLFGSHLVLLKAALKLTG